MIRIDNQSLIDCQRSGVPIGGIVKASVARVLEIVAERIRTGRGTRLAVVNELLALAGKLEAESED